MAEEIVAIAESTIQVISEYLKTTADAHINSVDKEQSVKPARERRPPTLADATRHPHFVAAWLEGINALEPSRARQAYAYQEICDYTPQEFIQLYKDTNRDDTEIEEPPAGSNFDHGQKLDYMATQIERDVSAAGKKVSSHVLSKLGIKPDKGIIE